MSKTMRAAGRVALASILFVSGAIGICGVFPGALAEQGTAPKQAAGILKPADMTDLMPAQVFFRGQSATVQMRNSGGIRYADGMFTLLALVDTSGYSSGIQQRYQAYLITEVPLKVGDDAAGHSLPPGAYGVGFIQNNRFIVMDLGAHELKNAGSQHDSELHRAMPLQILDGSKPGAYRLYEGRDYVTIERAE